ncbi:MAG: sulfite exporter TauE/SafE family protein [Solirubrobacteraceae bacterium]
MIEVAGVLALGFAAGVTAGLFGVGGGILVVLALTLVIGLGQLEAQATSLLSVIPVALVGAWRQHGYGNLRLRDGLLLGALAAGGSVAGVAIANSVSERALEVTFACLVLFVAFRLVKRSFDEQEERP